jgi:glycine/D-amino acid oxidase-like deaminating enzyme
MSDDSANGDLKYDQRALDAIADAEPYPFWLESADIPESNPTLVRDEHCDLCIVGGGYTGLWTAVIAKERDPSRDVVLIDKGEVGGAASGRNGGFMEASLTHGVGNGMSRHADEIDVLEELGLINLNEIEAAIERYSMDCDYERNGVIDVAHVHHPPSYLDELREEHDLLRSLGQPVEWLDQDAMRAEVDSPTYTGGLFRIGRAALVDPAKLAWELKRVAEDLGVRIYEHTRATSVDKDGRGVAVVTPLGTIRCAQGGAGHQRRQAAAEADQPVHGARLRLLPRHRTAVDRAARPHRLGEPPRAVRHHEPVPLLPAHLRQPDPVGRLRRHLLLGLEGVGRAGEPPGHVGETVGALLRDVPAAR